MYPYFVAYHPQFGSYPCPPDMPLMSAIPLELQTLFNSIPTLLMFDQHNELTPYYRSRYQRENNVQDNPKVKDNHIHLLVCHDPDALRQEGLYKFITPQKANELIQQINTHGNIVADPHNNAYVQIEKMKIGTFTINITFLFGSIQAFFSLDNKHTHLLEVSGNRFIFKDPHAFCRVFGLPPRFENIQAPVVTDIEPNNHENEIPVNTTVTHEITTGSNATNTDTTDKQHDFSTLLNKIPKRFKGEGHSPIGNDSFYSVLEVDPVQEDENNDLPRFLTGLQTNQSKHKNAPSTKQTKLPIPSGVAYRQHASLTGDVTKAMSSATQYLWTTVSSPFRFIFTAAASHEKAAYETKRLARLNNYLANSRKPVALQLKVERDPVERFLNQFAATHSLENLAHAMECMPLKRKVFRDMEKLKKLSSNELNEKATNLKVSEDQIFNTNHALFIFFLGLLVAVYQILTSERDTYNQDWSLTGVVMLFGIAIISCVQHSRKEARAEIERDVVTKSFEYSLMYIERDTQSSELLFYKTALLLCLLKEAQSTGMSAQNIPQTPFGSFMQKFTGLLADRPSTIVSDAFCATVPLDGINRINQTTNTMCTLLLIHAKALPKMMMENSVPEITIPYMSTDEQIQAITSHVLALKRLVTSEFIQQGRKIKPHEVDVIFNHLDHIMLIYVLRNNPNNDPFFESFRQDYAALVNYANDKVSSYINEQNHEADWMLDTHTIHQAPVKSKLFSCAWVENRIMAVDALKRIVELKLQTADIKTAPKRK